MSDKQQFEKRDKIKRLQLDACTAKGRLISIMYQLEEIGANREAKSLGKIITELEAWQHK